MNIIATITGFIASAVFSFVMIFSATPAQPVEASTVTVDTVIIVSGSGGLLPEENN